MFDKSFREARINNYDWMRVFAMCMVILNHIADYFISSEYTYEWTHHKYAFVCESVSHCAIPLFLMLTGVFVIDKAGNKTPKEFYIKSVKKLGIPFCIFIIIYFVYDICIVKIRPVSAIFEGVITGFSGMYAHWYVVMIAVIYAFLPMISYLKKSISCNIWEKGVIAFFIWVMFGHYYENSKVSWSLCNMYFIGYVLIGDLIHNRLAKKKNNLMGIISITIGIVFLIFNGILLNYFVSNGGDYYNKLLNLYGAPLIILASLIIFIGFSVLDIKKEISWLANISYMVFLCHKLVIDIIKEACYPILEGWCKQDVRVLIVIEYMIVFPIALALAYILYTMLNKLIYRRI